MNSTVVKIWVSRGFDWIRYIWSRLKAAYSYSTVLGGRGTQAGEQKVSSTEVRIWGGMGVQFDQVEYILSNGEICPSLKVQFLLE
jgi:hypothetical protein